MDWISVVLLSLTIMAADPKSAVDGIWVLDSLKSELGSIDDGVYDLLKVEQRGIHLSVIGIARRQHSKSVMKLEYTLADPVGMGFLICSGGRCEQWKLSGKGNELIIQRHVEGRGPPICVTLSYRRSTSAGDRQ